METIEETTAVMISPAGANEVIYLQDKAQIDTQIATAKAFPRNIKRSTENAIAISTLDKETAATCTYSVPRGGKSITGPSVHLAKILAQCWGNMRIETKVIAIEDKHVTSQGIAFDLENNLAYKAEVKRSIMTSRGRMNDDMIVVTGNAANAIALRNAVFAVIPKSVIDKAYKASIQEITGDISDENKLIKKRKQVVDGLKNTFSVTEEEIFTAVGKSSLDHIGREEIVVLIGIGTAIKDGDTTVDDAFKRNKPKPTVAAKETERLKLLIGNCQTVADLMKLQDHVTETVRETYEDKFSELAEKETA